MRLIRRNCRDCLQPYDPEPSQLKIILKRCCRRRNSVAARVVTVPQHRFSGRMPVTELLVTDEPFREAV